MSDPYRSAGHACPLCKEVAMRGLGRRLICDSCGGMHVELDDFTDMIGGSDVANLVDEGATALACPRCAFAMRACQLHIGTIRFDATLARCEDDGVWLPGGALEEIFTRVGRAGHGGAGMTNRYGGVGSQYVPMYQPKSRPIPPPVPTSQFQDRRLTCPVCDGAALALALERWTCAACGGAFVENAALVAMVGEMIRGPWALPPPTGIDGKRACPVCALAMQVEWFEEVEIDRCPEHAVWFDPSELGDALAHAGGVGAGGVGAGGVGAWLRRLF